ncbi:MAG: response regulator [Chitinivibrionales bacterium]|nr:response regulator [Chitinivibrionales bacterium]MBD3357604.1 response regulator [Chitinivibrionales bacterium]
MDSAVFIIDDEEIICKSLEAVFRRHGIETMYETNPLEALRRYELRNYNVVLVDVLMPQMKGSEVIARLKRMNPMCNIIVMTAFSNMTHVIECVEAGAADYITKPFSDVELLMHVVGCALERVSRWRRSFGLEPKGTGAGPVSEKPTANEEGQPGRRSG